MTNTSSPCQRLAWDSEFWGFSVAQGPNPPLTLEHGADALHWCRSTGTTCMYFRCAADDAISIDTTERLGFHCVDIRLTFELRDPGRRCSNMSPGDACIAVRPFSAGDLPALQEIARTSYGDTRFYFDKRFPRDLCDRLYETWLTKSCGGDANLVLIAECESGPTGYITCVTDVEKRTGTIGLVGVAADARGQGLGRILLDASLHWFGQQDVDVVHVVTQGRNIAAQRLYQHAGFATRAVELSFHWWNES